MADGRCTDVRFDVLGPLMVWRGDTNLSLGPPQQQILLATLLVHAGHPVAMSDLVVALWGEDAPNTAVNLIHRYVGQLRRLLEPELPMRAEGRWLVRDGSAYRMRVDSDSLDVLRFRALASQAREAGQDAVGLYGQALALWRGSCAAGTRPGTGVDAAFTALDQEFLDTVVEAADAALARGDVHDILQTMLRIAPDHPLNEVLHARLMLLLAAAGKQDEALEVYRALAENLVEELGVDPGPGVAAAHRQVLRRQENVVAASALAQLPRDLPAFSGRAADLRRILDAVRSPDRPVSVVLIDGMPGVGKTTTAVHLAHELAGQYPDGQLFLNLRGFDPATGAVDPADALRHFLHALGVADSQMPTTVDAQAGLYRSLLAGKRVLVVLDNARDAAQVSPLIPGSSSCLTIVTSRSRLTSLIVGAGAYLFTLHPMAMAEARALVTARLGDERGEREREAVDQIVAMCGRLPLALAVTAGRAAMLPDLPLHTIARDLASATGSLDAFSRDENEAVDIRAVFHGSYRRLSPDAARMFRLLALHWGPDISMAVCASMAGVTPQAARAAVGELSRTRLLIEHVPGRFEFHDLVRVYALELSEDLDSAEERDAAIHRMLDYYLISATNLMPAPHLGGTPSTGSQAEGVHPETQPVGADGATAWVFAEQQVLETVVTKAAEAGFAGHGWRLAVAMQPFYHRQSGLYLSWLATAQAGYAAAVATGDRAAQARASRSFSAASFHAGNKADALHYLTIAGDIVDEQGGTSEKALILRAKGTVLAEIGNLLEGDYAQAFQYFEQAAELYRSIDEKRGMATTLCCMGVCLVSTGEPERGIELYQQAIELFRSMQDVDGEASTWADSGIAYRKLGDYATAIAHHQISLAMDRETNHYSGQICNLLGIGEAYKDMGEPDESRAALAEALSLITPDRMPMGGWPNAVSADQIKEYMASLD